LHVIRLNGGEIKAQTGSSVCVVCLSPRLQIVQLPKRTCLIKLFSFFFFVPFCLTIIHIFATPEHRKIQYYMSALRRPEHFFGMSRGRVACLSLWVVCAVCCMVYGGQRMQIANIYEKICRQYSTEICNTNAHPQPKQLDSPDNSCSSAAVALRKRRRLAGYY